MIQAVFFDIDGTLISFRTHTIPQSTLQALQSLRERGVKLFISSGRHPLDILPCLHFPFDGYVALNGGYCLTGAGEVIFQRNIDPSDIENLIQYQSHAGRFACVLAGAKDMVLNYMDERVIQVRKLVETKNLARILSLEEWSAVARQGVMQLIAFFGPDRESALMRELFPHCRAMRWSPLFTDIVPLGVSKAEGIDKMLAYQGISLAETMAFGDGGNDIPMLQHVPLSVAMGNAAPEVKQAASYVTTSVDDHGVARALRHFGVIE